jgi:hypothetical protein
MKLIDFLSQYYYCLGLMVLVETIALAITIRYYRRHKELRVFPYYLTFSLLEVWAGFIFSVAGTHTPLKHAPGIIANIFMLFEYSLCNFIILRHISSKGRRRAIYINSLLFVGVLAFAISKNYHFAYQATFFLFESVFLLLPCLLYFYELFVSVQPTPLKDQPSFWVVTGFLFLNACSIPMLMTVARAGHYHAAVYSLNYILYSIFSILLIRAYRCPPQNRPVHAPAR